MNNQNGNSINMTPINSSNIKAAGYLEGTLYVQFLSGNTFSYLNVPAEVYNAFMDADSKGKYFASSIKGQYETQTPVPASETQGETDGALVTGSASGTRSDGESTGSQETSNSDTESETNAGTDETIAETASQDDSVAGDNPADTDATAEKTAEEHHLSMWQEILNHFGAHSSQESHSDANGVVTFDLVRHDQPEGETGAIVASGTFLDLHNAALQGTDPAEFAPQMTTGPQATSAADDTAGAALTEEPQPKDADGNLIPTPDAATAVFVKAGETLPVETVSNPILDKLKAALARFDIDFKYEHAVDDSGEHWNVTASVGDDDSTRHVSRRIEGNATEEQVADAHDAIVKELVGGSR